jgi:hypothetical protein
MAETRRQRLRRRRRIWRKKRTNDALRAYLKAKAACGFWDDRYCDYYGVSPDVVGGARRFIMRGYARGLVPTSTKREPVGAGSYHNARDAKGRGKGVDLGRRRHISAAKGMAMQARFQRSEFRAWQRGKRPNMVELIGPDNNHTVLRDAHSPIGEGTPLETQHDTHVHGGFTA